MSHAAVVVSLHDVDHRCADACRRWMRLLAERGVVATALVVCGPLHLAGAAERRGVVALLDEIVVRGGEVSIHGWSHVASDRSGGIRRRVGRLVARGCEEFWTLDRAEAEERIRACARVLDELGHTAIGMTPPGWMASPDARRAMADAGLRYRTDHLGIHDLHTGHTTVSPALSHRSGSAWQRPAAHGFGLLASGADRLGTPLRISLHPADLDHPHLVERTLQVLYDALERGRRSTTYADLVSTPTGVR
ncbi:MAG: DUF2334 domain-containing protein [Actinomycetota bacterium]